MGASKPPAPNRLFPIAEVAHLRNYFPALEAEDLIIFNGDYTWELKKDNKQLAIGADNKLDLKFFGNSILVNVYHRGSMRDYHTKRVLGCFKFNRGEVKIFCTEGDLYIYF